MKINKSGALESGSARFKTSVDMSVTKNCRHWHIKIIKIIHKEILLMAKVIEINNEKIIIEMDNKSTHEIKKEDCSEFIPTVGLNVDVFKTIFRIFVSPTMKAPRITSR